MSVMFYAHYYYTAVLLLLFFEGGKGGGGAKGCHAVNAYLTLLWKPLWPQLIL